jgi:hypothetical protein
LKMGGRAVHQRQESHMVQWGREIGLSEIEEIRETVVTFWQKHAVSPGEKRTEPLTTRKIAASERHGSGL